jgi:hypothetical protein
MGLKKFHNNISTEDLLSALSNPTVKETSKDLKEEAVVSQEPSHEELMIKFITEFNIKPGKHKVRKTLLWNIFKNWTSEKISRSKFGVLLNYYFISDALNIYINKSALRLSKNSLQLFAPKLFKSRSPKIDLPSYHAHFRSFLRHYGIKDGQRNIYGYLLFYLYDKWVYKTKFKNPIRRMDFNTFCKKHLKHLTNKKKEASIFKVNTEVYNHFTEKEIAEIQHAKKRPWASEKAKQKKLQK